MTTISLFFPPCICIYVFFGGGLDLASNPPKGLKTNKIIIKKKMSSINRSSNRPTHESVLPEELLTYSEKPQLTNAWSIADNNLARITHGSQSQAALQAGCLRCVWMPNWAHNNSFSAPTGFAIALQRDSYETSISPFLFHNPTKYGYGTLAIPLPSTTKNKREGGLLIDYIRQLDRMASGGGKTHTLPSSQALNRKLKDLIPSKYLEHAGSFAGIYVSTARKKDFSEKLWVVVQAGDAVKSTQANRVLQQEGSSGTGQFNTTDDSWNKYVEWSTAPFAQAKIASKKRRGILANVLLNDLFDVDHEGRDISAYDPMTTVTDVFSRLRFSGRTCVYYAGCTPAKHGGEEGRILLNESPRTGIFVLHGVVPNLKMLGAFPYGTGRVSSMAPFAIRSRRKIANRDPLPDNVFCWDGASKIHPRLHHPASDLFRLRNREFRKAEILLGREASGRVIHLRPLSVKMAEPSV